MINRRRRVRKAVHLNASIVSAKGISDSQVTDVSPSGCRLHLFTPPALHQYLALELECEGYKGGIHIPLAQVQWTKDHVAGVEFVYLPHETRDYLSRLCGDYQYSSQYSD